MSEPEKTIKVVDRRMFTADGELRDEVRAELDKPDDPAPAAEAAPSAEPVIPSDPAFLRLLDMLAQTASLYLTGIPDPATGQRQPDLHGARQMVASLAALREKPRGRLSFEETAAIEGLLGELQLAFARLTAPPKGKGPVPPVPRRG